MKAFLILENGTVFEGTHIGDDKEVISEIVFDTAMVGYLSVLTDPTYAGQAVCMTYPLIGNFGISKEDMQSSKVWPDGFIVKELSRIPSNFRCDISIQEFLEEHHVAGIAGIDTRALTKILRDQGTMNGMITTNCAFDKEEVLQRIKAYKVGRAVEKVTCQVPYQVAHTTDLAQNGPLSGSARFDKDAYEKGEREPIPTNVKELNGLGLSAAVLDLGAPADVIQALAIRGCSVSVYPAHTKAEEILAAQPDGILISNGPGDPKEYPEIVEELKKIYESDIPVFAIGLGHQLMALATGADTYKMKCGHRGGNHPSKDLVTGQVHIVTLKQGYAVDASTLDETKASETGRNVNDGTNTAIDYVGKKIFSVQYRPEGNGGLLSSSYLYDRLITMMKGEN